MNIGQAKEYIKDSVRLYLKKDEFGEYRIPVVRQRPIFLLGAPGIGKTAVMEQIAREMGIALVSYSMTHHTRQSALGLPFITRRSYGGEEYSVSEYTMSEIIASVHDTMESSGIREGILFLDEINCVSETLAPSMLQFLQYKVFGRHRVPEGWVIVTAGNPPEYNKSVREFDVATYDRLKVMEVEPDYNVWKRYAAEQGLHGAVVSYLDLKREHFYCMETVAGGRSYVTPRGWEDLAKMLQLYEEEQLAVDESLVGQYLRNERIVREFTAYYDLYNKYKKDYNIEDILRGKTSAGTVDKARKAALDERLSLLGMLLEKVQTDMKRVLEQADFLKELKISVKAAGAQAEGETAEKIGLRLEGMAEARGRQLEKLQSANALSEEDKRRHRKVMDFLAAGQRELLLQKGGSGTAAYELLKNNYGALVNGLKEETGRVQGELHELFSFAEAAFGAGGAGAGNEMLVLVTELTVNTASARFLGAFGSPDYQRYREELMLTERGDRLREQIAGLELPD